MWQCRNVFFFFWVNLCIFKTLVNYLYRCQLQFQKCQVKNWQKLSYFLFFDRIPSAVISSNLVLQKGSIDSHRLSWKLFIFEKVKERKINIIFSILLMHSQENFLVNYQQNIYIKERKVQYYYRYLHFITSLYLIEFRKNCDCEKILQFIFSFERS